jgi:hypothetical protein
VQGLSKPVALKVWLHPGGAIAALSVLKKLIKKTKQNEKA